MQHVTWPYLVSLAIFLWPAVSHGDEEWSATFVPEAAGSYLPAGKVSIMVVPAGAASPERDAAAQAFLKALSDSGKTEMALDNAVLGEVGESDDPSIMERGAKLSMISHIAVLRILESTPPKALVTIYATSSTDPLGGFVAIKGIALSRYATESGRAGTKKAGQGVSSEAMKAVDSLRDESKEARSEAQAKYNAAFVGYNDITIARASGWTVNTSQSALFWVGQYKRPVGGAAFYKAVSRSDLATRYSTRMTLKVGAYVGAGLLLIGGLAYTIQGIGADSGCYELDYDDPRRETCLQDSEAKGSRQMTVGLVLMGTSLIPAMFGRFFNAHPVSVSERRRLADEHNQRLRKELGIEESAARSTLHEKALELRFTPVLSPVFQGLALEGRF